MKQEYDIMLNDAFDLVIKEGDFVGGENLNQQIACLLMAEKGSFKQSPTIGVGINSYLLDEGTNELNRELRLQCKKEDLVLKTFAIHGGKINLNIERG